MIAVLAPGGPRAQHFGIKWLWPRGHSGSSSGSSYAHYIYTLQAALALHLTAPCYPGLQHNCPLCMERASLERAALHPQLPADLTQQALANRARHHAAAGTSNAYVDPATTNATITGRAGITNNVRYTQGTCNVASNSPFATMPFPLFSINPCSNVAFLGVPAPQPVGCLVIGLVTWLVTGVVNTSVKQLHSRL